MKKRTIGATLAGALLVTGLAGGAVAVASGGDEEGHVAGPGADKAVAAALVETGGGTANAVERDSEDGAVWEVEVTKPDGFTVDVRLGTDFETVVVESDVDDGGSDACSAPETCALHVVR
jgi:hypothetical protein